MTAGLLALASLLAGLAACRLLAVRDRTACVALVPGLGGALALGAALLAGTALPAPWAARVAAGVLAVAGGAVLALVRRAPRDGEERARTGLGTWAALALLGLGAWLFPVGSMRLDPGDDFLIRQAPLAVAVADHGASAAHLLGPEAAPDPPALARLMGSLGGDPLETGTLLAGAAQVLALLALFGGLRAATGHSLAAVLGAGAAFLGTPQAWVAATGPGTALAHLLGAGTLAALLSARGAAAGAAAALLLPAAALVDPAFPLPLALATALAALMPLEGDSCDPGGRACGLKPRAQLLLALAAAGAAVALGARPQPRIPETSLWTWLLPLAAAVAWRLELRGALVLAAGEGATWALGGTTGSSVLAAGSVFATAGVLLARAWEAAEPGRWRLSRARGLEVSVPWRAMVAAAVLFLAVQGLEPGETALNRQVLLAGQKRGASLQELAAPTTLAGWVADQGSHRGLSERDLDLARKLAGAPGDILYVAPRSDRANLAAAAVIASLARRPIDGWHADPERPDFHPATAALSRDLRGLVPTTGFVAVRGTFQGLDLCALVPVPALPSRQATPPARLSVLAGGPAVPGEVLPLVTLPPAPGLRLGYRVTRDGAAWGRHPVEFEPGRPLLFPVPRTPGAYGLQFYARAADGGEVPLGDGGLEPLVSGEPAALSGLWGRVQGLGTRLPSRSLLPFHLVLVNPGPGWVDLSRLEGLRLEVDGPEASPEERAGRLQPLAEAGALGPGKSVSLLAFLPTPLAEGSFRARVSLVGPDGETWPLRLEPPLAFRTWRRIPSGGAW